ncbi:hypothetical protein [Streptomyces sp. HNM0574]|uniref:hypothetical protein n=1 Tax=Streptomyces sp. HNM0574 TaxID=2714954 RepID=UPI00146CE9D4|nr:hypothetical protein [Streptomyces sp. HNM0574]NLU70429.1 hypothetical protein [Streptomyces sp. HNM0574]
MSVPRLAVPCALVLAAAAAPLLGGTAHAGQICTVVHHDAPRYAEDRVDSRIIGTMQRGQEVGVSTDANLYRVSRADNGAPLGFMQQADVDCGNAG